MILVALRIRHVGNDAVFRLPGRAVWACLLLVHLSLGSPAAAQQVNSAPTELSPLSSDSALPRDNAAYIGVTTRATVTQRFEIYNPHSVQELRAVQEMGFTQVILDWPSLYEEAAALGLHVVTANWWTDETPEEEIERAIDAAKQLPRERLAGISMMDEPERNSPGTPADFYAELYQRLRARLDRELPGVPLEISHWGPLASWTELDYYLTSPLYKSADVMRIMPYPDLHEGPLSDVYFQMQRSKSMMAQADRGLPLLVILQTWTLPPKSELPTIDELRVMAYQAMLTGATTLSFYHYRPEEWERTAGFHEGFAGLMRELTQLSQRFAAARLESTMTAGDILESVATFPSGETILLRINTNREPTDGLAALAVEEVSLRKPQYCVSRHARPMWPRRCFRKRLRPQQR